MNTTENNRLIAEFMGINYEPNRNSHESSEYFYEDCELEYHTSWDWLMPVVSECLSKSEEDLDDWESYYEDIDDAFFQVEIKQVWSAVIKFITWYNENKEE